MATACMVMADAENSEMVMSCVFDGGFDKDSVAHAAMRRLIDMIDKLGVEVVDRMVQDAIAVPEPMLVDSSGHTMIPDRQATRAEQATQENTDFFEHKALRNCMAARGMPNASDDAAQQWLKFCAANKRSYEAELARLKGIFTAHMLGQTRPE